MAKLKFYGYDGCSTCRAAKKALDAAGIAYTKIDITTEPPSAADFRKWLKAGHVQLRQLFNTSGEEYRNHKVADKIKSETEEQLLARLAGNGRLVKRPIITDGARVTVGFKDPAAVLAVWNT